jgi:hypothetical protein
MLRHFGGYCMGFLGSYAANIVAWAGILGSFSYFLGYIEEVPTFFRNNREMMIGILIVHFAIFSIYYALSAEARKTRRLAERTRKND